MCLLAEATGAVFGVRLKHTPPGVLSQPCEPSSHGCGVGAGVGVAVGAALGAAEGADVGAAVGATVGALVGEAVGAAVGEAVMSTHAPPCARYPASHSSSQLLAAPCLPFVMWCACSFGVSHGRHMPAEPWPQPKRYSPVMQSLAQGVHRLVASM